MEWVKNEGTYRVPVKSWCSKIDDEELQHSNWVLDVFLR